MIKKNSFNYEELIDCANGKLFGTGNAFSISAQLSRPSQSLNFSYTQPYFTLNGISHLLEHMAFKGTKNRNAKQIVQEIENVGLEQQLLLHR